MTQPYVTQPYVTQPYVTQPYVTQPYVTQPYVTQPYVTQPYVTQPYVTQPYVTQPYVSQPYVSQQHTFAGYPFTPEPREPSPASPTNSATPARMLLSRSACHTEHTTNTEPTTQLRRIEDLARTRRVHLTSRALLAVLIRAADAVGEVASDVRSALDPAGGAEAAAETYWGAQTALCQGGGNRGPFRRVAGLRELRTTATSGDHLLQRPMRRLQQAPRALSAPLDPR